MTALRYKNLIGFEINIWMDELPLKLIQLNKANWIKKGFECGTKATKFSSVAVEVFRPMGASYYYGMLGARYTDEIEDKFVVSLPTNIDNSAFDNDFTYSTRGLGNVSLKNSEWYSKYILSGVESVNGNIPKEGLLTFQNLALSDVGSCGFLFECLSASVLTLLTSECVPRNFLEAEQLLNFDVRSV